MTFSPAPVDQVARAEKRRAPAKEKGRGINFHDLKSPTTDVAKVSVVGIGMRSHAGVAAQMFRALRDEGINIRVITTSEIKISVLHRPQVHGTRGAGAATTVSGSSAPA